MSLHVRTEEAVCLGICAHVRMAMWGHSVKSVSYSFFLVFNCPVCFVQGFVDSFESEIFCGSNVYEWTAQILSLNRDCFCLLVYVYSGM